MKTSNTSLKVLMMAGGTGGHVFPALSVAENLRSRGHDVEWLGTSAGIEFTLVPAKGIALHCISVKGVRGKGVVQLLKAPFNILKAVLECRQTLKMFRPDVVVGFGGFASGPGGFAAKLLGIPIVIHEQNAIAGTTNRILAKFANLCLAAFPNALPKAVVTGNPVRQELLQVSSMRANTHSDTEKKAANLLVLGGSLGARFLNQTIPAALALLPEADRPNIVHQCGKKLIAEAKQSYLMHGVDADIVAFIENMADAYQRADIVICRAGAMTVAEIATVGRAALFVPFPYAIDDHQTANAEWLVSKGAGELRQQTELSEQQLADLMKNTLLQPKWMLETAEAAKSMALPNACHQITDCIEEVANGH